MSQTEFALFETPVGRVGIAWGDGGLVGVQLPERDVRATRARLRRRFPGAREADPPVAVRRAQRAVVELLSGRAGDLSGIALDLSALSDFQRRVYEGARSIPAGTTCSYGELAARIGARGGARAVGQALGRNPFALIVPCHRVLAADGSAGGFTAEGGVVTKLRLLELEGVARATGPVARATARGSAAKADRSATRRSGTGAGLAFDPRRAVRELRTLDPTLARLMDVVGPFRLEEHLKRTHSIFGALAEAIVHQQLSGKAARTIWGRLCGQFPRARHGPSPAQVLAASDAQLRTAGLSRAKVASLRDLAERTRARQVPGLAAIRTLSDDEIVERLTAVRGIGRWTAEMLLIFRLGRPDVLPVDDLGVRKGFEVTFRRAEPPTPRQLAEYGERWAPWRTVASWYLWRAADRAANGG